MSRGLFSFSREEHLKSKTRIDLLFSDGKPLKAFPIKAQLRFIVGESDGTRAKIGFVVSKRSFKKAVDRNRIKRQMIEVFRLNRAELMQTLEQYNCYLDIMLIYVHRESVPYEQLEKAWTKLQLKLIDEIRNRS